MATEHDTGSDGSGSRAWGSVVSFVVFVAIMALSRTEACIGRDGVYGVFERTRFPLDVEPLGTRSAQAGTRAPNQTVEIESNGRTITIRTHAQDLWPGQVFEIRSSGEVFEGHIFAQRLSAEEVRGVASLLVAAGQYDRARGGAEAEVLEHMAAQIEPPSTR
jgi:hypothetical protein